MKNVEKIKLKDVDIKHINVNTIFGLYLEYKEVINYLIFGAFTMVVNFASYFIFAKLFHIDEVVSSGLSWFCAVLFAYITNKIFVFESKTNTAKELLKEIISFFGCRAFTGILDVAFMYITVEVFNLNDMIMKIISNIVVIIVNYIFSKLIIFKKDKRKAE